MKCKEKPKAFVTAFWSKEIVLDASSTSLVPAQTTLPSSSCVQVEAEGLGLKTNMRFPIKTVSSSGCRGQMSALEVRLSLQTKRSNRKCPPHRQNVFLLFKRSFRFLRKFSEAPFPCCLAVRSCLKYLRAACLGLGSVHKALPLHLIVSLLGR